MEDIQTLRHIVKKRDWLAKINLKDVYLTIPLILGSESFVFQVGREIFFHFISMLFGLASALRAFTKLFRSVVAFLKQKGIRLLIYLDGIYFGCFQRGG
jgi:hypothetical protein